MRATDEMKKCFQPWQWFVDHCEGGDGDSEGSQLMWISRPTEDGRWMVGYFLPDRTWHTDSVFLTRERANLHVRWLNGGDVTQPDPAAGEG